MPNKIVVNGCSFSQELYLPIEDRWSTHIGCHTNLAHGGGSNDRIFNTTIEYLNSNDTDCMIIGWSEPSRTMLTTREGTNVIVNAGTGFDEATGQSREDMQKFYYLKMYNPYTNLVRTLNHMLHLQEHCKLKQIKLLYWNAMLPDLGTKEIQEICSHAYMDIADRGHRESGVQSTVDNINNLLSKLDRSIWIKEFWHGIRKHCGHLPKLADGHPGSEASKLWAELIKEYL
jgi:hypothetical protein